MMCAAIITITGIISICTCWHGIGQSSLPPNYGVNLQCGIICHYYYILYNRDGRVESDLISRGTYIYGRIVPSYNNISMAMAYK